MPQTYDLLDRQDHTAERVRVAADHKLTLALFLLRRLEWSGWYGPTTEAMCPICYELKVMGQHAESCLLDSVLRS